MFVFSHIVSEGAQLYPDSPGAFAQSISGMWGGWHGVWLVPKADAKTVAAVSGSPPSADEIENWLAARTPQRSVYSEGREKYRAAKLDKGVAGGEAGSGDRNVTGDKSVTNDTGVKDES